MRLFLVFAALVGVAASSHGLSIKFARELVVAIADSRVAPREVNKLRAAVAEARTQCGPNFPEVIVLSEVIPDNVSAEPTFATRVVATFLLAESVSQASVYQGTVKNSDTRLKEVLSSAGMGDVVVEIVCTPHGKL